MPSIEELERKPIIVTTLVTADMLVKCGVKPGFFTHIFIDEAAQAMEVETIIPLSLATDETQVVLAGDHLQVRTSKPHFIDDDCQPYFSGFECQTSFVAMDFVCLHVGIDMDKLG